MHLAALVASALTLFALVEGTTSTAPAPEPEPAWGRIYLRRGLAPIQYFRDAYGGPMVAREVEFYFPRHADDRLGCAQLPAEDQDAIRAANGSLVLVLDRGVCTFEAKSRLAEELGAAALVIVSQDESAKAPVAIVGDGEIAIASVMVRKSAGDMLWAVAQRERVFGRLVPVVCERRPYACKPRTAPEATYIAEQSARSGVVVAWATNETLGDFLAASYGSILPSGVLEMPRDVTPIDGCDELDPELYAGKLAVFSTTREGCSALDQVSSAQRAGAVAALLTAGDAMKHPSVTENWHAYNITIGAAAVSSATVEKIVALSDVEIQLVVRNRIAGAWDEVRRLSVKNAWPARKDRQAKLLQRVVGSFDLDDGQLQELKHHFLSVVGGSRSAWDQAIALLSRRDEQPAEVAVEAIGV